MSNEAMPEWAQWFGSQGLHYFPLHGIMNGKCRCPKGDTCGVPGKHPRVKWTTQPSQVPNELDNIGVSTEKLVVIDFDADTARFGEFAEAFTSGIWPTRASP